MSSCKTINTGPSAFHKNPHGSDEVYCMENARRLPPTWLMGLTNAPFGLTGGFCAVVIPELLAAHGIPPGHVAAIAAAILSPGFWIFAISPCWTRG